MKVSGRRQIIGFLLLLALAASSLMSGCSRRANSSSSLVLFAASSLSDVMDELVADFERQNPAVTIRLNYASSGQLAVQLTQGIEADLFVSADLKQMETARRAGRIEDPVQIMATNELVILTPRGNPAGIAQVADLADPGLKLLVATPDAPLRGYTEEILAMIEKDSPAGNLMRERIMNNVVSEEDNARQVVAKIALGEADAAFAYRSDAFGGLSHGVNFLRLPPELRVDVAYPIAVVRGSSHRATARRFIDYVLSPVGQETIRNWGFSPGVASE